MSSTVGSSNDFGSMRGSVAGSMSMGSFVSDASTVEFDANANAFEIKKK